MPQRRSWTTFLLLLLTSCGGDPPREEARAARLLVASAEGGELALVDLRDGSIAATFTVDGAADLHAGVGERFAFVYLDEGVRVLDGGVRYSQHGSHFHLNFDEPSWLEVELPSQRPSGFAHHDDRAALFFEGAPEDAEIPAMEEPASVWVITEDSLWLGEPSPRFFSLDGAHLGFGIPMGAGLFATGDLHASDGPLRVARGLVRLDAEQTVSASADDLCALTGLHAAIAPGRFALGCDDGVVLADLESGLDARHVVLSPAPQKLAPDPLGDGFFADRGARRILWLPFEEGASRELELDADVADFAAVAGESGARLLVLTVDGRLHALEGASLALASEAEVVSPFAGTTGARPRLVATQGALYLSSPETDEVIELDEHGAEIRRFALGFAPGALVVLGPGHVLGTGGEVPDH